MYGSLTVEISGLSGILPEVRNRPETNNIEISRSGHSIQFYTISTTLFLSTTS